MNNNYQNIRFTVSGGVAVLTLHRPERLNSFTGAMHLEVRDALARVAADASARALVLTGAGRGFCAGQDLNDRAVTPDGVRPDLGDSIERYYKPLVLALRNLEKPVIAAVNGVAAGAGANIALACDVVLAARSAAFIQSFSKLGLVPDAGGTYWLPKLLGPARALGLAWFGDRISADQAEHWGLIWKCVADEELMPLALELAGRLASGSTQGFLRTRQAMRMAEHNTIEQQLDVERDFQRELGAGADYLEGVTAFLQKRAPRFGGH